MAYRVWQNISSPWGACDGTGPYDDNDPTVYYTGTIASVSGTNPYTVTVTGNPGWSMNQWVNNGAPYSIHDATASGPNPPGGQGSEISASSTNTLTVTAWTSIAYATGDSISIRRAYVCIDQPGRGGNSATLLSGDGVATPSGWVNEPLDPIYEFADTSTNVPSFAAVTSNSLRIIANRDYYAEVSQSPQTSRTSPFNGTVGTGYGTLANRPTTCTQGTAYWATDQGSWNTGGNNFPNQSSSQGELFICGSSGWPTTASYTPYVYPHPLVSGATPPSSPCDVNGDGVVNVADVQLEVNAALGIVSCTSTYNLVNDGCTVVDVQRVVNAALGGQCVTGQ